MPNARRRGRRRVRRRRPCATNRRMSTNKPGGSGSPPSSPTTSPKRRLPNPTPDQWAAIFLALQSLAKTLKWKYAATAIAALGAVSVVVLALTASPAETPVSQPPAVSTPVVVGTTGRPIRVITQAWTDLDNDGKFEITNIGEVTVRIESRTSIVSIIIPDGEEGVFTSFVEANR